MIYTDVSAINQLIDYVRKSEELYRAFATPLSEPAPLDSIDEAQRTVIRHLQDFEIARIVLSIADRAAALGDFSERTIRHLYALLESGRLAETVSFQVVVPVMLVSFEVSERLLLDEDVWIESLTEPMQLARAPDQYPTHGVPAPLISAATHAIVIDGITAPNRPYQERRWTPGLKPHLPSQLIDLACHAIQICTSRPIGYSQVLARPLGWSDGWLYDLPELIEVVVMRRYPERFDSFGWLREVDRVSASRCQRIPSIFRSLRVASQQIKLAARRLWLAEVRDSTEDRVVDACIGLEALLGEGRDELSHRLALRAATALSTRAEGRANPQTVYDIAKHIYSYHSAIVHGTTSKKYEKLRSGDKEFATAAVATWLLREVLADQLDRQPPWTPTSLDKTLLSALSTVDPEGAAHKT